MSERRLANHLAGQTSPYLLQHLYNPVDWYPWGPEALERARSEDRPIFLSIGYAACHWCHVMERESFENDEIAEMLNRDFVPIKVDREERPDLDAIYMNAVQLLTGQGGWPMSMFLTPDGEPFAGGTYFPPEDRYGRLGFPALLGRVRDAWNSRRDEIGRTAVELTEQLKSIAAGALGDSRTDRVGRNEMLRASAELAARFDARWGGFSGAPKFPPDGALALLLREHQRTGEAVPLQIVQKTLDAMALGGMYDHVGGGFSRYSVDERWLVPHFEKMLYNQALLVPNYLDAWLVTRQPLYRRVVEQTLDFVRRELTDTLGGFHSSLDADSEGVEGRFYVWTPDEIEAVLGVDDARRFAALYDITPAGNFEGRNIPNLLGSSLDEEALADELEPLRLRLLEAREKRVRPGTDDKALTAWNGLMLGAFARAHAVLGRPEDLETAGRAAEFLTERMLRGGRLNASWRLGTAALNGYLDDYAFLGRGLIDLYEACFEPRWLQHAAELAATLLDRFEDRERGGFFFTSDDHETLLTRSRSTYDGALPSGAGVAVELLLRLAVHLDEPRFRRSAERTLAAYRPVVERMPSACASLLIAADLLDGPLHEIAVVADDEADAASLLATLNGAFHPRRVLQVGRPPGEQTPLALLRGKTPIDGLATAYVCHDYACSAPTTDPDELASQLGVKL